MAVLLRVLMKKNRISITLLCCLLVLFVSCGGRYGSVDITVVSTGDIHGKLYETDYLTGEQRDGSMLQAASLVADIRKEKKNVLYFDTGDLLIGSGESYYDVTSDFGNPSVMATMLDQMGCNAFVPGNHEFDLGIPTLDRLITSGVFPVVCANMVLEDNGECYFPPYTMIEQNGVRIAVVGFTTMSINYKIPWELINGLTVISAVESASEWVPYIKENENPDLIFAIMHSGLKDGFEDDLICENEALKLAQSIDGIDAIFYGHDHEEYCGKVENPSGDSVLVVNPGCYAESAAITTISLDFKKKEVVAKSVESEIVSLKDVEPDSDLEAMLDVRKDAYVAYLDSTLGTTGTALVYGNTPYVQTSAMDYIHSVLQRSMTAEVTLTLPVPGKDVKSGPFTLRDAIEFYPYENTIVSMMLFGSEIEAALEKGARHYSDNPSKVVTAGGLNYVVDLSKPEGERVQIKSMADGTQFSEKKLYRVTMDSYLAYSLNSPFIESLSISREKLKERLITTTRSDIRYHIIINHSVMRENNKTVQTVRNGEWSVVNYN